MSRFIFVVGGVMSGIGKGITTASIGRILKNYGYKVTALKIDPYINVDAGTMNPIEHGEVFVTQDGLECDQDIGNYERFLGDNMYKFNYMTTGSVYNSVISKERNLCYGGKCVRVVPHIPDEVIERIESAAKKTKADFTLVEIGGTVGEYENLLFLEAGRIMKLKYPERIIFVIVSYLPIPNMIGEMKTKPTQHAVRSLNAAGIQPDIIIARSERTIDKPRKEKIAIFCNVKEEDIISAPDIKNIYEVPLNFEKDNLSRIIFKKFNLGGLSSDTEDSPPPEWKKRVKRIKQLKKEIKIGIIGKYFASGKFTLSDSYISVIEAVKHAAWQVGYNPKIDWLDSELYEKDSRKLKELLKYNGIIVPGGFGARGVKGKIKAIKFCRENKIPFLGLCYGMQLAAIEFARNVCGLKNAHTTEIDPKTPHPVIHIMEEQKKLLEKKDYGGSMRLGAYECKLKPNTISYNSYKKYSKFQILNSIFLVSERHRHRYEFNNEYREQFEKAGMIFSGINPKKNLAEIMELDKKKHPFFVGVQFHPEFQSNLLKPHPLFLEFLGILRGHEVTKRKISLSYTKAIF
ncbi:MAG: CTP synthase [Candidatus Tagabacteria bacterium RIFCSPLOWO2_01_FULL_39_11]|uniref:CTP synthase n=1 Tax=Candidatus Tagabacteria bacterium RIFCSPLOWO2_01_FULL_39_11 TaxID=1802295 RepID=A0A1G2LPZ2_9BACT|nr:MAG: CTP synthase [Candidatus Tagabacteria bacterium RIFCSPLOWO2_01_FULL_39_11]